MQVCGPASSLPGALCRQEARDGPACEIVGAEARAEAGVGPVGAVVVGGSPGLLEAGGTRAAGGRPFLVVTGRVATEARVGAGGGLAPSGRFRACAGLRVRAEAGEGRPGVVQLKPERPLAVADERTQAEPATFLRRSRCVFTLAGAIPGGPGRGTLGGEGSRGPGLLAPPGPSAAEAWSSF